MGDREGRGLKNIKQNLTLIIRNARLAKSTLRQSEQRKILYNVDFALIYGYLFEKLGDYGGELPEDQSPDIARFGLNVLTAALQQPDRPFELLISVPTIYEFARHAMLTIEKLENSENAVKNNSKIYDTIAKLVEERSDAVLLKSENISRELDSAVAAVMRTIPEAKIAPSWKQVTDLIENFSLQGFGNFYTRAEYEKIREHMRSKYNLLYGELNRHRHKRDTESYDAFYFRNKIDVNNLAACDAFNRLADSRYKANFLGAYQRDKMSEDVKDVLDRSYSHPAEAALILSCVSRIQGVNGSNSANNTERQKWLDDLLEDAGQHLTRVQGLDSLSDVGRDRIPELAAFFERARTALYPAERQKPASSGSQNSQSQASMFYDSYESFVRAMGEARTLVANAANSVFAVRPVVTESELLVDFSMDDDPIVNQIKKGTWRKTK